MSVSGSPKAITTEVKLLKEQGHHLVVVNRGGPLVKDVESSDIKHYTLKLPIMGYSNIGGIEKTSLKERLYIAKFNLIKGRFFSSVYQLNQIVKREKIDIIQAHQPGPSLVGYCVAKMNNIPFILRVQHILMNEFPPLFYKKVVEYSSKVSVITPEVKNHLVTIYGLEENKISVIPTAVKMSGRQMSRNHEELKEDKPLKILTVTTFGPTKYHSVLELIKAVDLLVQNGINCELTIVGDGPHREDIEKQIERSDAKTKKVIKMEGQQSSVERYFIKTDVVVGVGRVAMEALYFGKPLLCCSHFSYAGLFDEKNAKTISNYNFSGRNFNKDSLDYRLIYQDLEKIAHMSAENRNRLSEFNMDYFDEHYDATKIAQKTESLFQSSIKNVQLRESSI